MAETDRVSNTALQKLISDLSAQMREGIGEIKVTLKSIDERVRALENNEAGAHPLIDSRIDAAWRKLDEHDKRITTLTDTVIEMKQTDAQLQHTKKLLAWLGGLLGSAVVLWLVGQILSLVGK
jgi:DNA repair exonuclease SbcCD ATPase subunit